MNKKNRWGMVFGLIVIIGSIGYLLFGKLEKNILYFVTPSELLAKGPLAFDRSVRLGGMVKKGTVNWNSRDTLLQFFLTDSMEEIAIISHETPPQMFQEEMGVVVEGKFKRDNVFLAERLMVKHSNEYHPPKEGQKPNLIYKDLLE